MQNTEQENELRKLQDENARLRAALALSKRSHYYCEDGWYSCPKAEDGCLNEADGKDCNCGADQHNARIDAVLSDVEQQSRPNDPPDGWMADGSWKP